MTTEIKVFYSTFPSLFQVVLSCFQVSALLVVFRLFSVVYPRVTK